MSCYLNINRSKFNPEGKLKLKYEPIRLRELWRLQIDRDYTTNTTSAVSFNFYFFINLFKSSD